MSTAHGEIRETVLLRQDRRTRTPLLAPGPHIVVVASCAVEVGGILQGEDARFTMTTGTDTMTRVIGHGDHGAVRLPYAGREMSGRNGEMSETSIEGTATNGDLFRASTTLI